jgi:hypothetical protein
VGEVITGAQVATLRALLKGEMGRYRVLLGKLDRGRAADGYPALVAAAFENAVVRRFGTGWAQGDIIIFVGDVRSRSEWLAEHIDPATAELMITTVLESATTSDLRREGTPGDETLLEEFISAAGDAWARSDWASEHVDLAATERLITAFAENAAAHDLPREDAPRVQVLLLAGLIADEHLDDAGLDAFLAEARVRASGPRPTRERHGGDPR